MPKNGEVGTGEHKAQTHLLVNEDADIAKNVAPDCVATALPIMVFPVPGGPKRSNPEEYSRLSAIKIFWLYYNHLLDKRATQ